MTNDTNEGRAAERVPRYKLSGRWTTDPLGDSGWEPCVVRDDNGKFVHFAMYEKAEADAAVLRQERDALREELAEAREADARWIEAHASLGRELEEAREALAKYGDDSRDTIDGLTEENARMREALQVIADLNHVNGVEQLAREALEEGTDE